MGYNKEFKLSNSLAININKNMLHLSWQRIKYNGCIKNQFKVHIIKVELVRLRTLTFSRQNARASCNAMTSWLEICFVRPNPR